MEKVLVNKGFTLSRVKTSLYLQRIELFEMDEEYRVRRTFADQKFLGDYYPQSRVQMVNFLGTDELCLTFDDEMLTLKLKQGQMVSHLRIVLSTFEKESVFLGVYKNAYVFCEPFLKLMHDL